jgi:hypothetical protein
VRRGGDTAKARAAKAAKREASRCRWARACREDPLPNSPFRGLHSMVAIGEGRSTLPPDDVGKALLFPHGEPMGTDPGLVDSIIEALDALSEVNE